MGLTFLQEYVGLERQTGCGLVEKWLFVLSGESESQSLELLLPSVLAVWLLHALPYWLINQSAARSFKRSPFSSQKSDLPRDKKKKDWRMASWVT